MVNFFNEVAANIVTFNLTGSLIVLGKETIQITMNVNSHEYYYNHTKFELETACLSSLWSVLFSHGRVCGSRREESGGAGE